MRKILTIIVISLFALVGCMPAPPDEPAEALALEQTYSAQLANGSVSLDFPTDWVPAGEFADLGVIIATSAELASNTNFDGTLEDGEVYINITYAPEALLEQDTPSAVLQQIIDMVGESEGTISEIEARTLNGKVAAFVTLDTEESTDGLFLVIDSGDAYSTLVVAFPDGELDQYQATVEAIAGSIEYLMDEVEVTPEMTTEMEMTEEAEATEDSE